ncbi:amidohydrolase, partial [Sulfolobus sp. F3]
MNEKELIMETAESWREDEINADVFTMNKLRPFYLYLRKELKKLLGDNFIEERNKLIRNDPVDYIKFLFNDAGIEGMVIDVGFGKKEIEIPV